MHLLRATVLKLIHPSFTRLLMTTPASIPTHVRQLPLDYQPADELFCVKAEYQLRNPANISVR